MSSWPATLPQYPIMQGYQENPADTIIRTKMDQGPDKVRRRTTANTVNFKVSYIMTDAQVATFDTFYNATISGGADKFTMPHPRTGVSSDNFRISSIPQYASINGVYRVSFDLELLPQ